MRSLERDWGTSARGRETFASTYLYSAEGVLTSQRLLENFRQKMNEKSTKGWQTLASTYQYSAEGVLTSQRLLENFY